MAHTRTNNTSPVAVILAIAACFALIVAIFSMPGKAFAASVGVSQISLGGSQSAALLKDGTVWMWGNNVQATPKKVIDGAASVSLGSEHSAAIKSDGSLWIWGNNGGGQLGDGTTNRKTSPVKLLDNVASTSLGLFHSAAIKKDGTLWMWGLNEGGRLGDGTGAYGETFTKKTPIKILDNVASVSLGEAHSAAIRKDGTLWMWGENNAGKLGDGSTTTKLSPIKVLDNVVSVSLGKNHSAAITKDGALLMWGDDYYGQITNSPHSTGIPAKVLDNVASVSLGDNHSAAIKKDGTLWVWGDNKSGQLGTGAENNRSTPVKLLDNVASVSLGSQHSAAITKDGSLWLWGNNASGQLGDGSVSTRNRPWKATFNILSPTLKFKSSSISKKTTDSAFTNTLSVTSDGVGCTYSSSNTKVATVNSAGKVTIKGSGSCKITATVPAGAFYKQGSAYYSLAVSKAPSNAASSNSSSASSSNSSSASKKSGKLSGSINVKSKFSRKAKGKKQSFSLRAKSTAGKLTYKSSSKKVRVSKKGKVIIKKGFIGKATITVKAKSGGRYVAKKKVRVVVALKKPKLYTPTNPQTGWMALSWKKPTYYDGVQFEVSTSKDFSQAGPVNVAAPRLSYSIESLPSGTYYVKIRAYKAYKGKTHYSRWSKVKAVAVT